MKEILEVGGLTFEIRRSTRRKKYGLTVDRDGELVIHSPETAIIYIFYMLVKNKRVKLKNLNLTLLEKEPKRFYRIYIIGGIRMPFHKIDTQMIIEEKCKNDAEFKEAYNTVKKEYSIIREVVKARKELGLTQENLAKKIGVKQQVISRFEQEKHIPTLDSFIRILDGIGLEIVLQKKNEIKENYKIRT